MNAKVKSWLPNQTIVINMVKKYPIIYAKNPKMDNKKYKNLVQTAWLEAADHYRLPYQVCKRDWTEIKFKYAKLKILINTGRVTEEIVQRHPQTSKYLDGTLSFLDPYLCDITEADISPTVNKKIHKIFGLNFSSDQHEEYVVPHDPIALLGDDSNSSDITQMDNASGNIEKHSLEQLKPNNNMPSNSNEETTWDTINLGLQSELLIEDNIKMEDDKEYEMFQGDNLMNDNNVEHILPDIDSHLILVDNPVENTLADPMVKNNTENIKSVMDSNVTGVSDNDILNFFNELGQVMSLEMSLENQKISRIQINSLVKEILDEERLLHS